MSKLSPEHGSKFKVPCYANCLCKIHLVGLCVPVGELPGYEGKTHISFPYPPPLQVPDHAVLFVIIPLWCHNSNWYLALPARHLILSFKTTWQLTCCSYLPNMQKVLQNKHFRVVFFEEGCKQIAKYTSSVELPLYVSCSAGIQDEKQTWKLPSKQETREASRHVDVPPLSVWLQEVVCNSHSVTVFNHATSLSPDHGEKTITLTEGRCSPLRCQDDAQRQAGGECRPHARRQLFTTTFAKLYTKSLLELLVYHSIQHMYR